jgi:hypothetical protein
MAIDNFEVCRILGEDFKAAISGVDHGCYETDRNETRGAL